jgi:hypothetical protein
VCVFFEILVKNLLYPERARRAVWNSACGFSGRPSRSERGVPNLFVMHCAQQKNPKTGFSSIRMVEHYFHYHGGYSPNLMLFLAAPTQHTAPGAACNGCGAADLQPFAKAWSARSACLTRSAMADSMSGSRAFLPHEFCHFGRSPDE